MLSTIIKSYPCYRWSGDSYIKPGYNTSSIINIHHPESSDVSTTYNIKIDNFECVITGVHTIPEAELIRLIKHTNTQVGCDDHNWTLTHTEHQYYVLRILVGGNIPCDFQQKIYPFQARQIINDWIELSNIMSKLDRSTYHSY